MILKQATLEAFCRGNAEAEAAIYEWMMGSYRFWVWRSIGADQANDLLHDSYIRLLRFAREGKVRSAGALPSLAKQIVQRAIYARWADSAHGDIEFGHLDWWKALDGEDLECDVISSEITDRVIATLRPLDQEILRRSYLEHEAQPTTMSAMGLNDTQYRLLKTRARKKFGEAGRKLLQPKLAAAA